MRKTGPIGTVPFFDVYMSQDSMQDTHSQASSLLDVRDLRLNFHTRRGVVHALDGLNFNLAAGECLGIVGETGCGKSVTARAIMGLVPYPGRVEAGEILFEGRNLLTLSPAEMRRMRGRKISFVFQEARRALDPTATIGKQILEAAMLGHDIKAREARQLSIATLKSVGLADAERIMSSYSFELSGGMAQRAMIGMAIVGGAKLVIADEPTSALDVSIQSQILKLLRDVRETTGSSLILITHDLGVAAENCDRVAVMYAGQIVEIAPSESLFRQPAHPYTERLLKALPVPGQEALVSIPGTVPDLIAPPKGCRFANRCDRAVAVCSQVAPPLDEVGPGHLVACYKPMVSPQLPNRRSEP